MNNNKTFGTRVKEYNAKTKNVLSVHQPQKYLNKTKTKKKLKRKCQFKANEVEVKITFVSP